MWLIRSTIGIRDTRGDVTSQTGAVKTFFLLSPAEYISLEVRGESERPSIPILPEDTPSEIKYALWDEVSRYGFSRYCARHDRDEEWSRMEV